MALALTFLVSCVIVVAIADLVLMNLSSTVSRLKQAIFYIERNPETVNSITSFPCIRKSF